MNVDQAVALAASTLAHSGVNGIPYTSNLDPVLFPKFSAALAKVLAGTGRCKIAIVGDSTDAGQGGGATTSGDGNDLTNAAAYSWPKRLVTLLNNRGISATGASLWGDASNQNYSTALGTFDTRVTLGTGWTQDNTHGVSLGGSLLKGNGANGTLSFTPTEQFDTCDIYYVSGGTNGTISCKLDAGTPTVVNTAGGGGANAISKATITGTLGTHTVNIQSTAGNVYLLGIDCYNAATSQVSVLNMGARGQRTGDVSTVGSVWFYTNALPFVAPDLIIYKLGVNDYANGVTAAQTQTNVSAFISQQKATSDLLFVTPIPAGSFGSVTPANQAAGIAAIKAATTGYPLLDLYSRRVSYTVGNTAGFYYDQIHQLKPGYTDIARWVDSVLARL